MNVSNSCTEAFNPPSKTPPARRAPGRSGKPLSLASSITLTSLLILMALPPTAGAQAAPEPRNACQFGMNCLRFTNALNNGALSVKDGFWPVVDAGTQDLDQWSAVPDSTSSFTLKNTRDPGKCLDANPGPYIYTKGGIGSNWRVTLWDCNGGVNQRWFFQPKNGTSSTFYIRNEHDRTCLGLLPGTHTVQYGGCDPNELSQQWHPSSSVSDYTSAYVRDAHALSVAHAAAYCSWRPNSCAHQEISQTSATPIGASCVSKLLQNQTGHVETVVFRAPEIAPFTWMLDSNLTVGVNFDALTQTLSRAAASEISGVTLWSAGQDPGAFNTIDIPDGDYGALTLYRVAIDVTSLISFDVDEQLPWRAVETTTVLVKDSPAGSTSFLPWVGAGAPDCGKSAHAMSNGLAGRPSHPLERRQTL